MRFVFQANAIVIGNEIPRNNDLLKLCKSCLHIQEFDGI